MREREHRLRGVGFSAHPSKIVSAHIAHTDATGTP
jgi:hypothetical protein